MSYGNPEYDGRLRDLINLFNVIGKVSVINTGIQYRDDNKTFIARGGILFYYDSLKFCFKLKKQNFDILVVDNRKPTPMLWFVKKILNPRLIIQDSRELYLVDQVESLHSKLGCIYEDKSIRNADILIVANNERASFMKEYYGLRNNVVVLENIRKLEHSNSSDKDGIYSVIDDILRQHRRFIISTAGCDLSRGTDRLVESMKLIREDIGLILVGNSSSEDEKYIKNLIKQKNISNVYILGNMKQNPLKYLMSKCDIGVVSYHQKDFNNKFCASGKLYEYLFEGLPVVTSTNPPLVNLCNKWKVGVSNDNFTLGIADVLENYEYYRNNVNKFASSRDPKLYIMEKAREIASIIAF